MSKEQDLLAISKDDEMTKAEKKVIMLLIDLSPTKLRYTDLARHIGYAIGTLRNIVSSASKKIRKHDWKLDYRYQGRVLWVGASPASDLGAHGPHAGSALETETSGFESEEADLSAYRDFVLKYHRTAFEKWIGIDRTIETDEDKDPFTGFADEIMHAILEAYRIRIVMETFTILSGYLR